jgi:hypothetical protein
MPHAAMPHAAKLFKLSVRLQGGPKRAAHAAAWASRRAAEARSCAAGQRPSAGVEGADNQRAAAETEKTALRK